MTLQQLRDEIATYDRYIELEKRRIASGRETKTACLEALIASRDALDQEYSRLLLNLAHAMYRAYAE